MAKVIAITSGKGGVGKTNAATNLALSLSALGKKVCVFDADASLANINILLGIQPEFTLEHLLNGEKNIQQIIVDGPRGIKVVPAASGIAECANLDQRQRQLLLNALDELQQRFDYLIIDTAAGISNQVTDFVQASQYAVVIITPEPTSLTDAFSLLKVLKRKGHDRPIHVLVNMALDFENSQAVFRRFELAVKKYISADVRYLGYCKVDETIISSVSLQCPAVLLKPESPSSQCFHALAEGMENQLSYEANHSFSDYWRSIPEQTESSSNQDLPPAPLAQPVVQAEPAGFHEVMEFLSESLLDHEPAEEQQLALFEAFLARYRARYPKIESPKTESNVVKLKATNQIIPDTPPQTGVSEFQRDPIAALYGQLEAQDFPEAVIQELVSTLEGLYTNQYGRGLRSFESTLAQLLSMAHGSESRLRSLHHQLKQSYERQFQKPFYDIQAEFLESVEDPNFTSSQFTNLLDKMRDQYKQSFGTPYRTAADDQADKLKELNQNLETQKLQLENQLLNAEQNLTEKNQLIEQIQRLLQKTKQQSPLNQISDDSFRR